jgi:hypothetical protein
LQIGRGPAMIEVDMGQEKDLRASGPEDLPDGPFIVRAKDAEAGIEQNRPVAVQEITGDLDGPEDVKAWDYLTNFIENQIEAFLNKRIILLFRFEVHNERRTSNAQPPMKNKPPIYYDVL